MKNQSTNLGQDREKTVALSNAIGDLIDEHYPGEQLTGKELFEILDALAMMIIFNVYSAPKGWRATFKHYLSQRLGEMEAVNKRIESEEESPGAGPGGV